MGGLMKKHAYLIIAHTNLEQLKQLLTLLDDSRNDIFILFDEKSSVEFSDFDQVCQKSTVQFADRICINWGGFSQIKAEIILFKTAAQAGEYSYYHLLSGMDLPLHNQDYIHAFFEKNAGHEFFTFVGEDIYQKEQPENRVKYYYKGQDLFKKSRKLHKLAVKLQDHILVPAQRHLGINRLKGKKIRIGYGSNWVSASGRFVQYLLQNEAEIEQMYRDSFCADELYKHTLLVNSEFIDKLYIAEGIHDRPEDRQGNLRYINWWTGSPRTWTSEDRAELREASDRGYLFSRKFDEQVDRDIIDYVCEMVKNEEFQQLREVF